MVWGTAMKPSVKTFWVDEGLTVLLAEDKLQMHGDMTRPLVVNLKDAEQRNSIARTLRLVAEELEAQGKRLGG